VRFSAPKDNLCNLWFVLQSVEAGEKAEIHKAEEAASVRAHSGREGEVCAGIISRWLSRFRHIVISFGER
jgi:hypothetical protein